MTERTDFLYPFLDHGPGDVGPLLADLEVSGRDKAAASDRLRHETLERERAGIDAAAAAMADRFARGARLYTFGNGGSSTDAAGLARLFAEPPVGPALPARSLAADAAVLTALGNDVGFDLVFVRQLIAHGRAVDIALALSTSGSSRNLVAALGEARARGLLTMGIAGYGGGEMATCGSVDHCLVVGGDSVHRIQETQAAVGYELWRAVMAATPAAPVDAGRSRPWPT